MRVIIYHGLGSRPSPQRDKILHKFGFDDVISEHHDYYKEWDKDRGESFFNIQNEKMSHQDIDLIIGISFGGYIGYHLSKANGVPAILINPALNRDLSKTKISHYLISYNSNYNPKIEIYMGSEDVSVPSINTISFLENKESTNPNIKSTIVNGYAHRVPDEFFQQVLQSSEIIKNI
jgi:predicted esterase YcpF (UPF0227 family)